MSILTLLNDLNISEDELKNISSKDVIRIEKQLKAKVKLDETIDINEVEKVITALKNNLTELSCFFSSDLDKLRLILTKNGVYQLYNKPNFTNTPTTEFLSFLNLHFHDKIKEYILICISESHYNALNSCTYYHNYFDTALMDNTCNQLIKKIEFATECINIHSYDIQEKIDFLSNPYFYRCLNNLGSIQFESVISKLMSSISLVHEESIYYSKIIYALSFFNSSSTEISKTLKNNKEWAISLNVSEIVYNSESKKTNGGTKLPGESDFFYFPYNEPKSEAQLEIEKQDQLEQKFITDLLNEAETDSESNLPTTNTEVSTSPRYSDGNNPKEASKNSSFKILKYLLGIAAIFVLFIYNTESSATKQEKANSLITTIFAEKEYNHSRGYDHIKFEPFQYNFKTINEANQHFEYLNGKIKIITSWFLESTSSINQNFKNSILQKENHKLIIENTTFQPTVVIIFDIYNDIRIKYIDSYSKEELFAKPKSIIIYTGREPQSIYYKDQNNLMKNTFRFKQFTDYDLSILKTVHDFSDALFLDNQSTSFVISKISDNKLLISKQ